MLLCVVLLGLVVVVPCEMSGATSKKKEEEKEEEEVVALAFGDAYITCIPDMYVASYSQVGAIKSYLRPQACIGRRGELECHRVIVLIKVSR